MNKFLKFGLQAALCASILFLAILIPLVMNRSSQGELPVGNPPSILTTIEESPKTLPEKASFIAKFLAQPEAFSKKNLDDASNRLKKEVEEKAFAFLTEMNIPGFLQNELENSGAIVKTFTIEANGGAALEIQNIYFEGVMDWSNWLNAYIDKETGKVLYLYASGTCVGNMQYYIDQYPNGPYGDELENSFASYSGYEVNGTSFIRNDREDAVEATYSMGGQTAEYKINCVYHPGNMYDFKFAPLP